MIGPGRPRRGRPRRRSSSARARAGFTLIELMISLLISSILVGMILSIFTRMSTAYRTQQHVAELQQVLVSAQELIQRDIRQAGYAMPDGFKKANSALTLYRSPVEILDNGSGFGPDELHLFYADPSAQAQVRAWASSTQFTVDAPDRFEPGDLVVISNYEMRNTPLDYADPDPVARAVARYRACVGRINTLTGTTFRLTTTGDWGEANNRQCDFVRAYHGVPATPNTMIYRLAARGYRIDPDRRAMAVLQLSKSGGLVANDWQDLGVGFTDLQVASRWYEGEEDDPSPSNPKYLDTPDLDIDPQRDWYSDGVQTTRTAAATRTDEIDGNRVLLSELRLSLVVRTTRRIDTIGTARTPALIDLARPSNNDLGNRPSVLLDGVPDGSRPAELQGDHLYRYTTVGSDLRNLSVTR